MDSGQGAVWLSGGPNSPRITMYENLSSTPSDQRFHVHAAKLVVLPQVQAHSSFIILVTLILKHPVGGWVGRHLRFGQSVCAENLQLDDICRAFSLLHNCLGRKKTKHFHL